MKEGVTFQIHIYKMQSKTQILEQARKTILSLEVKDMNNKELINKVTELRVGLDEFLRVYRFPHRNKIIK